jgi:hypothetical protein
MMINWLIPIGFSRNGGNNERDTFLSCRFEKNLKESEKGREREREREGERALSDRRYPSNEP